MGVVDAIGRVKGRQRSARGNARRGFVCGHCNRLQEGPLQHLDTLKVAGFQAGWLRAGMLQRASGPLMQLRTNLTGERETFVSRSRSRCTPEPRWRPEGPQCCRARLRDDRQPDRQVAKARGAAADSACHDVFDHRLEVASGRHRARHQHHGAVAQAASKDIFGLAGFDIALEAAGVEASLAAGIDAIQKGGKIVIVGVYGKKPAVDMAVVGDREIELSGSLMYLGPDGGSGEAARLLGGDSSVDLAPLLLRCMDGAYATSDSNGSGVMKVMLDVAA